MTTIARLYALSATERRALLEAAAALGRVRLETRFLPFSRIVDSSDATRLEASGLEASGLEARASLSSADLEALDAVTWAVRVLGSRIPWYRNCLVQAVAAKRLLRRRGIASTLHLGVAKDPQPDPFEAHAWLEAGGRIITGRTGQTYDVLYSRT